MKNFALCFLTLGIASSAFGSACVQNNTLAQYITAGSCTFTSNGQTYNLGDFTFVNATAALIGDVSPGLGEGDFTVAEGTGANGPTVTLTATSSLVGVLATETVYLGFDITSQNAAIGFSNVNLGETTTGTGIFLGTLAEEDCFGGLLPVPSQTNLLSLGNGGLACLGGGLSAGAAITTLLGGLPVNVAIPLGDPFTNSVDVLKEINLTSALGSATFGNITQGFTTNSGPATAPEPGSFLIGGCGLLGLALLLRRRAKGAANQSSPSLL